MKKIYEIWRCAYDVRYSICAFEEELEAECFCNYLNELAESFSDYFLNTYKSEPKFDETTENWFSYDDPFLDNHPILKYDKEHFVGDMEESFFYVKEIPLYSKGELTYEPISN